MFFKIGVLKNFENHTGKHLFWSLYLIKLQIWRLANLLKRDSNTGAMHEKETTVGVVRRYSSKNVFLKISQISQEYVFVEVTFW